MKRCKYTVHATDARIARFSDLRDAMIWASDMSVRLHNVHVEVRAADGLVGQYRNGQTTDEFAHHHAAVFGAH